MDADLAPQSPELELAFLGSALLTAPADGESVLRRVDGKCFTRPTLGRCWAAISAAWRRGDMADPLLVASESADGEPTRVMMALLRAMSDDATSAWYLESRADKLVELKTRRELMQFGAETTRDAHGTDDLPGLIAHTARYAEMLDELRAREETGELGPVAVEVEHDAENGVALGWQTGIRDYDEWSAGMRRGEVHIVGGASGIGKSWVVSQMANAVADEGLPVAVFSLEMTRKAMYVRLMASRIGLKAYRLMGRGAKWEKWELEEYRRERDLLVASGMRLFTDQRSLADVAGVVRSLRPAVALVDYVQLMAPPPGARGYEAARENAEGLQALAKRADCCVVLASQVSREALKAGAGRAVLGAEGAGRWDHIADVWVEVRRGEIDGQVELVAAKVRSGPTGGTALYRLDPPTGRLLPV